MYIVYIYIELFLNFKLLRMRLSKLHPCQSQSQIHQALLWVKRSSSLAGGIKMAKF